MNKIIRRVSIVVAASAVSIGLLGVSAPAQASDSSWGWITKGDSGGASTNMRDSSWGW